MKTKLAISLACVLGITGWSLAEATGAPAPAAVVQVEKPVQELVDQLGNDSPEVRDAASEKLEKMGAKVVPQLNAARGASKDPEVHSRLGNIVARIQGKDKPAEGASPEGVMIMPGGGQIQLVGGGGGVFVMRGAVVAAGNDGVVRSTMVNENGKEIKITDGKDGISMSVTENGETKEYKAKDFDELKKNSPEAADLYEKHSKGVGDPAKVGGRVGVGRLGIVGGGAPADADAIRARIEKQMKAMEQNEARMRALMERQMKDAGMAELDIGKMLGDFGEPDAMADEPKLGVRVEPADEALVAHVGKGLVVRDVLKDTAAARMGVKELDLIKKVNGQEVADAKDVAKALNTEKGKTNEVEVLRQGKSVTLKEIVP